MKHRCEYCGKLFEEEELDYLILTNEYICLECLEELRQKINWAEDPHPFP